MKTDEEAIRGVVALWQSASRAGDVDTVLSLMTDDVVFLVAGRAPMNKAEFAAASRPPPGQRAPTIAGSSDIQEVVVAGDWAFLWTKLSVVVTPSDGGPPMERAGHTLTVFRKENGAWRLARDANLLAPVQRSSG
jgi:uncharacterized protein (TIGR02246 family)